ncbi:MAG: NAD(P)/FAD-dependent oxidoreductase [Dehalococcoidia bacterium]|nr:NAD(P)/FAD-dependent oxidoreductase [Dehalococcoidia bacterium]
MHYKYVIVGGGMTGDSAIGGIREVDTDGSIALFGDESEVPYNRPHLSKGLWHGKSLEDIQRDTTRDGVDLHLGRRIEGLDLDGKSVTDDQGASYTFDKLLLATGGSPRRLPFGGDSVIYFRTVDDYRRLRALADSGDEFLVIGGGFIGSEIVASLSHNDKRVTMVFPEPSIGSSIYPADLSSFLNDYYREHGVEVLAEHVVSNVETRGDRVTVTVTSNDSSDSREIVVDGVVAGLGIEPNVELARKAGLNVDDGISVDGNLNACHPDVYAAGDVANYCNDVLERRIRVEHEDSANTMGAAAGKAMAGEGEPFSNVPYFWSDMFDLGYEVMGHIDSGMEIVPDWKDEFKEGVVYYLEGTRVRGVLLWNMWDRWGPAGDLVADVGPHTPADLMGRIQ